MESASKRRATLPNNDQPPAKRVKGAPDAPPETPETTTDVGLKFLENLKNAKDKTGRPIATEFLRLPDRGKLIRGEYANLTAVESDAKRMVANAKQFNDKKSAVYEDAERVRKTASNFMTRHNPAYRNSNYVAQPTPIPDELLNGSHAPNGNGTPHTQSVRLTFGKPKASSTPQPARAAAVASPKEPTPAVESSSDFKGMTFQQAQEQLLNECIEHEDGGALIFTAFINLPPRSLADYYQLIKQPMSLKGVQKKVRGQRGRDAATGKTDLKSWQALEDEMSLIWTNAREYNQDGSPLFNLAGELETFFHKRLAIAKKQVQQPTQPTLKLKVAPAAPPASKPSIKLKFGGSKASPGAASPAPSAASPAVMDRSTPGVIVHNEALERQKEMVASAMNGDQRSRGRPPSQQPTAPQVRNPFGGSRPGSNSTPLPALASAGSPPVHMNGIKNEAPVRQSPGPNTVRPSSAVSSHLAPSMAPPLSVTPRVPSGSPYPQQQQAQPIQPSPYQTNQNHYQQPQYQLQNGFVHARPVDQNGSSSILPDVTLITHPALKLAKPLTVKIPAHATTTQQSITLTVPFTHQYFQVVPHLPVGLTQRPYRVFVTVNGQRMSEAIKPGAERDKSRPIFEARLERGTVGRIEVEVLAGKGPSGKSGKEEVEWEKCSIFVHVWRD
ncbi:hypothetical protein Vi05172_g691 [Venturia inaequalis]|nr:hypothetical protein Vi05172_g691 [Venturia inaequalis]